MAIPRGSRDEFEFTVPIHVGSREVLFVHARGDLADTGPWGHEWIVGYRNHEDRLGVGVPDVQLVATVAVDVRQHQVVDPVVGKLEDHAPCPPPGGVVGAFPPEDVVSAVTGPGYEIEFSVAGKVDEGCAHTIARERVVHQVRHPGTLVRSAEPVNSVRVAGGYDELLHAVAVEVADYAVHALGGIAFIDGVTAECGYFRHFRYGLPTSGQSRSILGRMRVLRAWTGLRFSRLLRFIRVACRRPLDSIVHRYA